MSVTGDEAWHAVTVKRIHAGDTVEVLDGHGTVATAAVERTEKRKGGASVELRVVRVDRHPPTSPRVEIWSAVPKADRAAQMIDQLAQAGAAEWCPLITERSVTDADHKADRLLRIASEASKQCGRPWHLTLGAPRTVADGAKAAGKPGRHTVLFADADGQPPTAFSPSDSLTVLVGPEGGFTATEIGLLREAGASALRLGPHILRTETAAVAAAVALLAR